MKFLTILFLLGLPGVARTSQLDARQVTPSGNSSVTLPSQSPSSSSSSSSDLSLSSSQIESTAPSLVATSTTTSATTTAATTSAASSATSSATFTEVTTSSSLTKQERDPQDPDVTTPGPPPAPAPTFLTSPVETTTPGDIPASSATTSTSISIASTTGTTTLAFSSPTIIASPEISSAQLTTVATTNTNPSPVVSSPSTTLITSKTTPSVIRSSSSPPPPPLPPSTETSESITTTTSNSKSISSPTATATATMSNVTPTPSSVSSSNDGSGTSTLTIALSTILSVTGVVLIAVAAYLCTGNRRRRLPMFKIKRGITPIGDDEIATWKSNRSAEKVTDRYTTRPSHSQNPSTATSTRRAPSVIQYHSGGRQSYEVASPRSFIDGGKYSFDLPQAPGAVLARAPNARSGLTDEAVPGDDPFLPSPKRHPSRLHKLPPNSPSLHGRTKGSRSSSLRSYAEAAWRDGLEQSSSPRVSSDAHTRTHNRIYSNSSIPPPPRLSFGDNDQLTGLSPPPSRRNDSTIGLAVG
ncbi:uncharacterized protein GGS22DRAFT_41303 [Annulohypoxylon maeteangense]|uniref:uncharacterized protein n=1 Tax=Annulohypoxylon maeteangense TaxID=1927788 RepID=UPI002007304D|nr:uncharacterized protein GGS22DRAFT_41303 [Annulohypoxylon maeteangense]KAI0882806.1 hypothetical protein GGS22DRAFT_41303 [Annulohypoxylon maeteangense]